MVDLSRDKDGRTRARLLDLVPGRSGTVYKDGLKARSEPFRKRVDVAIDDQLADATAVLDAFHVVKLATQAVDEVRRRVQQDTLGHRGKRDDPAYKIRTIMPSGVEHLTDRQQARLADAIAADERHQEVHVACRPPNGSGPSITPTPQPPRPRPSRTDHHWLPLLPDPRDRPAGQRP